MLYGWKELQITPQMLITLQIALSNIKQLQQICIIKEMSVTCIIFKYIYWSTGCIQVLGISFSQT